MANAASNPLPASTFIGPANFAPSSYVNYMGDVSGGASFDTGGYTGNQEGIAMLHKKELVLNQQDSKNFLDAAYSLRNNPSLSPTNIASGSKPQSTNYITNVKIEKLVADNADKLAQQLRNYVFKY